MKIITSENFQEKNYSLKFNNLNHGKTEKGEYLSIIFDILNSEDQAILLLTPTTNYENFKKQYSELVGDNFNNLTISEVENKLSTQKYNGDVKSINGINIISDIKVPQ